MPMGIAVKEVTNRFREELLEFAPIGDRVLIKRVVASDVSKGGIIIPDQALDKPQEGQILAIGEGKIEDGKLVPLRLKIGDRVLFGKYSGCEIKLNEEELVIMREEEVMGVLKPRNK